MSKLIKDCAIGERIFFKGDWRTEPGYWTVSGVDELTGSVEATADNGEPSSFFPNVTVYDQAPA